MKQELVQKQKLPEGWKWSTVQGVCKTKPQSGGTPLSSNSNFYGGNIPWVITEDLTSAGKYISSTFKKITPLGLDNSNVRLFPKGTVLFAMYGSIGRMSIAKIELTTNQAILGLIPNEKIISSEYLYYYLDFAKNILIKKGRGGTQSNINAKMVCEFPIICPPILVQQQIVSKLDAQMIQIEIIKKEAEKEKGASEEMFTSLIEEIFSSKKEFKLPRGWKLVKLKDITSKLGDGLHGTPEYSHGGNYFFINGNNLNDGKILIKQDTKKVSKEECEKYKKELNDRTIFISINGTLGNVAFYNNENVILSKSVCYFNVIENIDKEFLKIIFNSKYFLDYCNDSATGSTIKNVSLESMRNFLVPLPDFLTQKKIVTVFNLNVSQIKIIQENISQKLSAISHLSASLLNEVLGKYKLPEVN